MAEKAQIYRLTPGNSCSPDEKGQEGEWKFGKSGEILQPPDPAYFSPLVSQKPRDWLEEVVQGLLVSKADSNAAYIHPGCPCVGLRSELGGSRDK